MASEEGWVGIADAAAHLSVAKDSIECQMKDMAMVTQRLIEFLARDILANRIGVCISTANNVESRREVHR